MSESNQVANIAPDGAYGVNITGMPMGLAIMFNDKLYDRVKQIAGVMAKATGFTPAHLIGQPEACFSVVTRSITWKLDPQAVAQSTYQTPGGRIGYEGKLIQAILENSGKLEANVQYELIGDWSKINGKFEIKKSERGKDYAVPTWTRKDAREGDCGVIVSAQVRGEAEPRVLKFMLEECFPLNSTLWATRPSQQIKYTACRAFANTVAPGILMGEPFDIDQDAARGMKDVTPRRPERADFAATRTAVAEAPTDIEVNASVTAEQPDMEQSVSHEDSPNGTGDFGHADAYAAGEQARDENKPLHSVPQEIDQLGFGETYKDGWRSRDTEMRNATTAQGGGSK